MQQQRILPDKATAKGRFKRAFWGRDSIGSAFLVYFLTVFALSALGSLTTPWLSALLGTTHAGMTFLLTLALAVPLTGAGWATAKATPRYSVVPWATVMPLFLLIYILPQVLKLWQEFGGMHWLIWQLVISSVVAFGLQSAVLLTTRRSTMRR